jgi:hypothetical protein
MADTPDYPPGTPAWVDLSTSDVDAAATFYGTLFAWRAEPVPDPDAGGYTMITLDGRNIGAMAPLDAPGRPPAWMTYISVEDADKTAALAEQAGGTVVMEPLDVLGAGRMAVLADPGGAAIALWQPAEHKGMDVTDVPGAYCWTELSTRDTDAAVEFYGAVFGWRAETGDMEAMPYTEFKNGDRSVAGMMTMPDEMPADVPPFWMPYFEVTDPDQTTTEAAALGGEVVAPPMDIPEVGRFAVLRDPQGALFGVIRTAERAA